MAIAEAPKAIRRSPGTRANNHVVSQLPKPADRPELIGALPVNNHSNTLSIGSTERVFMGHCARRMIVAIVLSRVPATAAAQTYLNKLMRILVPNAASGAVDALSRTIAQALAKIWGSSRLSRIGQELAGLVDGLSSQTPSLVSTHHHGRCASMTPCRRSMTINGEDGWLRMPKFIERPWRSSPCCLLTIDGRLLVVAAPRDSICQGRGASHGNRSAGFRCCGAPRDGGPHLRVEHYPMVASAQFYRYSKRQPEVA